MAVDAMNMEHLEAINKCIESCRRCHSACLEKAQHLIGHVPSPAEGAVLSALVRCIGTTRLAAEMLLAEYGIHQEACLLCATTCRGCIEACKDVPGMEHCVEVCLECERCCQDAAA